MNKKDLKKFNYQSLNQGQEIAEFFGKEEDNMIEFYVRFV